MRLFELISDLHFAAAIGRCQARPAEARRWDSVHVGGDRSDAATWSQCLPLHRACSVDPSPNLIAALLSAYPDAIAERESYWGRLPLHVTCLSGASYNAVQPLLQRYPQGGSVVAIHDRLPLHYACGGNAPRRIVLALLKIYPRGARCLDAYGELAYVRDACVKAYLVPSFLTMLEYNLTCLSSTRMQGGCPCTGRPRSTNLPQSSRPSSRPTPMLCTRRPTRERHPTSASGRPSSGKSSRRASTSPPIGASTSIRPGSLPRPR